MAVCGFLLPKEAPSATTRLARQLPERGSPRHAALPRWRRWLPRRSRARPESGAAKSGHGLDGGERQKRPPPRSGPGSGHVQGSGPYTTVRVRGVARAPTTQAGAKPARLASEVAIGDVLQGHAHGAGGRSVSNDKGGRELLLRRTAAVAVGALCVIVLGGLTGWTVGGVAAFVVWRSFGRLGRAEQRRRQARLVADLPVAVDLLAACLRGGTPWAEAVEAVATAVGGPLGDELKGVATQIRLGADPAAAWLTLADEPMLAPLARTAVRAASSGSGLAPSLARLARDQRRTARTSAEKRARAAGVRAIAPLGLCFLPAFVLLGLVPAIAGIAATLFVPW
ncbi:type II secretion system F family protein [Actinomadura sp. J1-007]|nr:type II secretion system F family protein [Actinomadura sp. J1-007]